MRGPIPFVLAGIAAVVAAGAVLILGQGDAARLDPAREEAGRRERTQRDPADRLVSRLPAESAGAGDREAGPTTAELLAVLREIRDELRALREARDTGGMGSPGRAPDRTTATGPAAPGGGANPAAVSGSQLGAADVEAAIRAGEAVALGREVARMRHYLEMERHNAIAGAEDGDAVEQREGERMAAKYDRVLRDLQGVRSFRQLMAFYHRWNKEDDVSLVYPKWDR